VSVFLFFRGHALLTPLVSLSPTVHGRGIMTAVLATLVEKWLIPYMNVHHMSGGYLDHNIASGRVFEKNGWVFDRFLPDYIELPEIMTGVKGKKFGVMVMKSDRI
jgi:RimJ/RimL family protein N-acetyltransferase